MLRSVMSMATIAKENNYVRPQLTDDNVIDIQGGRYVKGSIINCLATLGWDTVKD